MGGRSDLKKRAEFLLGKKRVPTNEPPDVGDVLARLGEVQIYQAELKQQNEELRESQAESEELRRLFQDLFDLAPLAYFTLNAADFTIAQLNQAGAALLDRESADLVGQSLDVFLESASRPILAEFLAPGDPATPCKLELLRTGGKTTPVLLQVGHFPDGHRLLLAVTDLTLVQDATEKLVRATRLEVSATLAAGMAHDLNNLMASVLGNADDLLADADPGTRARESLEHIIEAARRAGSLAQQMLAYARGGKYHPRRPI